ncbi:mucin-3A [Filimonas sp.]|nr:mucin-3A [Filimonas sp.]
MKNVFSSVRGSRFAVRGSRFAVRGSRFAVLIFLVIQIITFNAYSQGPSPTPYFAGSVPDCMKTNLLPLHTGVDWRSGTLYPYTIGNHDQYWSLIHKNSGPTEYCAFTYNTNCGSIYSGTRAISETPFVGSSANNWNPIWGWIAGVYTFRRHVWVDLPITTTIICDLTLNINADDRLDEVRVNNVALSGVHTGNTDACSWHSFTPTATFHGGDNVIDFDIRNIDFSSGGSSSMFFDLLGWVSCNTCTTPLFVDNNHYIPNTPFNMPTASCATNNIYDISPTFTGHCITPPGITSTVSVTNVQPGASYTLTTPGASPVTAPLISPYTFVGTLGSTYTVTASLYGCDFPSAITLTDDIPIVSLTTTNPCINFGVTSSSIGYNATAGVSPYVFSKLPSTVPILTNPFFVPHVGHYTVQVTDAVGCTSTSTIDIGNNFTLSTVCLNGPPCAYIPSPTYVFQPIVSPTMPSIIGGISCVWNGSSSSIPIPNNWSQLGTAGIYTVVATDEYGCTATASYAINTPPVITASSNAAPCNPILSYTSSNTVASQFWDDPVIGVSYIATATYTPPFSIPASAAVYTVTVTDNNGCTGSSSVFSAQDPFCCNPQAYYPTSTKKFSSLTLYNNGTASAILAAFGSPPGGIITTNNYILLDGNIIIDVPIQFVSCPNIRLTGLTRISLNPNMTLTIDHSTMRSLCTYMWKGITATANSEKILINHSYLRDMSEGVVVESGAKIESTFGRYTDNYIGIQIRYAPVGYNKANLNCIITDNTFTSTNYFLLQPYNSQQKTETGILIYRCREVQIGDLSGGSSQNIFDNLYNGVDIKGGGMGSVEHYYFYDNYFTNIKSDFGTITSEYGKLMTWASTSHRGAGIYSRPIGTPFPIPNHTLHLVNDCDNLTFYDCDKATALLTTSAEMSLNIVKKCLMGFMFSAANNQKFLIHDNNISEGLVGMRFAGNVGASLVNNNWLYMRDTWSGGGLTFPIGIDVQATGGGNLALRNNDVSLTSVAGSGITLRSTGGNVIAFQNDIHINDMLGFPTTAPVVASGIFVEKANKSILQGNKLIGNTTLLTSPSSWNGLRLSSSIYCVLDCNHFTKSRTGLSIVSNCNTSYNSVKGNTFDMHGIGLVFQNLGTSATLGDRFRS